MAFPMRFAALVVVLLAAAVAFGQPSGPETIDGRFDVGGHELYLNCAGTGGPTVVYLHGAIFESHIDPHANGMDLQRRLQDTNRFCVYDRRNLGHSDTVDAPQEPEDVISDFRDLMAAAGIEPPYVLLGASFGGLIAYAYANTYPDEVVGMVLLDSPFPDELSLEHLIPAGDRYEAFDEEDRSDSLERISHYALFRYAEQFIGSEPEIPVVYFGSQQEPRSQNDLAVPAYDSQIDGLHESFVARFAPGKHVWVDSPHFMEPEIPSEIAEALREVLSLAVY